MKHTKHTLTITWESRKTIADLLPGAAAAWLAGNIKRVVHDLVDIEAEKLVVNLDGENVV